MSLSRPLIQLALYFLQKLLRDVRKIQALGDILSNETVCILVCPTFPGMIGPCKEESYFGCTGNPFVFGKLQTVVCGNGFNKVILLQTFKNTDNLVSSLCSSWILKLPEPYPTRYTDILSRARPSLLPSFDRHQLSVQGCSPT